MFVMYLLFVAPKIYELGRRIKRYYHIQRLSTMHFNTQIGKLTGMI